MAIKIVNYSTDPRLSSVDIYGNTNLVIATAAILRTTEPSYSGQVITLLGHTTAGIGGGLFRHDASDTTTADDDEITIVTSGGKRWKRIPDFFDLDGNIFGINPDNTESQNTLAINALDLTNKILWLKSGTYNITGDSVEFVNGLKILSKDGDVIRFKSSSYPVLSVASGIVDNIEFHGELETTSTNIATDEYGLFDCRTSGSSKNWNLSGIKFYAPTARVNGVKLVASSSANTILRNFENINIDGQEYVECGRMGFEIINQGTTTITGITIASEAVFTFTGSGVTDGNLVFIENIVGTNAIDDLNLQDLMQPNVYRVTESTPTTFKLIDGDGIFSTVGGTYTSGGDVRVYRYSGIKGRVISKSTGISNSNRGMGVSIDGYGWGNDIEVVGYSNPICAIENIGASWSVFKTLGNGSHEPISSSNTRNKFSNSYTILGRWGDRALFTYEHGVLITDESKCYLKNDMIFQNCSSPVIARGADIEGGKNYGAIFENCSDCRIDGTLSNKNATSPFSVCRFYGSGSIGGIITGTLIKASSGEYWDQTSSATGNDAILYRKERNTLPVGSLLPDGLNFYNNRVTPVGTTSTCIITFASTSSWRPAFVEISCTASTTGGGDRGAAKTIIGLTHNNSSNTQESQKTDIMTNANCVITVAYGTNSMTVTCTVVSGTPINWSVLVSDFTGNPQSVVIS